MKWAGWVLGFLVLAGSILLWPAPSLTTTENPQIESSWEAPLQNRLENLQTENRELPEKPLENPLPAAVRERVLENPSAPREESPAGKTATPSGRNPFGTLEGFVLTEGTRPLSGILLKIAEETGLHQSVTHSDENGFYRFMLPAGTYKIQLEVKEGKFRPKEETVKLPFNGFLQKDFVLSVPLVEVPVLDWETRAPIPALSTLPRLKGEQGNFEPEGYRNGKLQFLGLPDGRFQVTLSENEELSLPEGAGVAIVAGRALEPILLVQRAKLQLCFVDRNGNPFRGTVFVEWREWRGGDGRNGWSSFPKKNIRTDLRGDGSLVIAFSFSGPEQPLPLSDSGCHSSRVPEGNYQFQFYKPRESEGKAFRVFFRREKSDMFQEIVTYVPKTGVVPLQIVVP